jgi:hypothetical protein
VISNLLVLIELNFWRLQAAAGVSRLHSRHLNCNDFVEQTGSNWMSITLFFKHFKTETKMCPFLLCFDNFLL